MILVGVVGTSTGMADECVVLLLVHCIALVELQAKSTMGSGGREGDGHMATCVCMCVHVDGGIFGDEWW